MYMFLVHVCTTGECLSSKYSTSSFLFLYITRIIFMMSIIGFPWVKRMFRELYEFAALFSYMNRRATLERGHEG